MEKEVVAKAAFTSSNPLASGANYTAVDVRVPRMEGHIIAGTPTLPEEPRGRTPAVVLITGAGQNNRNMGSPSAMPFRDIADALSSHGIAVLGVDDRGTGESTGDWATATTVNEARDIEAAIAWLRGRAGGHRGIPTLVGDGAPADPRRAPGGEGAGAG